ncbi:MAG: tRNA (adenosine(37)-N6)-threonylcarbamoyltransferase complex transferase subunit TsaD [Candidatus Roizmanbacteria bacterium]|nr:tRNA (adenosine(37)-N6)-threonylcarbamoyltransferase complex transferase subunit TsaD [Candidatus Roizmanbacteria bacterium]
MNILAIDTSCDETAVAVTNGRKILSNIIYSQVLLHQKWGGVVPSLAKRAHEERIDGIVALAVKKSSLQWEDIDAIAVTQGPGLAIALGVGISKAKELAQKYNKPLLGINHLEGHLYSVFAQNSKGKPEREIVFPYLSMIISGGHTEFILWKNHLEYEMLGSTLDDAAGEALDKAGKLLGLGYPAGAVVERLAETVKQSDPYEFPRPMLHSKDLNFSFSGLNTSFYYFLKKISEEEKNTNIALLASSFQEAVFDTIIHKAEDAIKKTGVHNLVIGGGVSANKYLRKRFRTLVKKYSGIVYFPTIKSLTGDNAAMIGITAWKKAENGLFSTNTIEREPRMKIISTCK